jgi:pimeloyl-ACP methyl ester carboxylesterase
METLSVSVADGVNLNVRFWPANEPGDGPDSRPARVGAPCLLVHGLASNARLWDGVAARTSAAGHPTCAVDLRSHGDSDAPDDGYDTATAAADLAAVCGALGLRGALVAGQSWGGNVVVRFAAQHPDLVAALVLVDGGWINLRKQFKSWRACEARLRPADIDGMPESGLRAGIARGHPTWEPWAVDATVANLRALSDGTVSRRLSIPRHMSIVRSMWDDPPERDFPALSMPVWLMPALPRNAGHDHPSSAAASAIPAATLVPVPGGDHDLHAQHPKFVAEVIVQAGQKANG